MDSSAALATPIQSYLGQATCASKVRPTTEPPRGISGSSAMVSDLSEYAETCTAVATSSHSLSRKLKRALRAEGDRVHHAVELDALAQVLGDLGGQRSPGAPGW